MYDVDRFLGLMASPVDWKAVSSSAARGIAM
jgi:hypothetical protein